MASRQDGCPSPVRIFKGSKRPRLTTETTDRLSCERREEPNAQTHKNPNRTLRSAASKVDLSLCLICQKLRYKKDRKLHLFKEGSNTELTQAVEQLKDGTMRIRMAGLDLMASKAKYHLGCYHNYVYDSKKDSTLTSDEVYQQNEFEYDAFLLLVDELEEGLFVEGRVYEIKFLLEKYLKLISQTSVSTPEYRSDLLQRRLVKHFGDKICIQAQYGQSKSSLVFSSSITVGQAVKTAATLKHSTSGLLPSEQTPEDQSDNPMEDAFRLSFHIARKLKSDITECIQVHRGNNTLRIHETDAYEFIPHGLYTFLRCLFEDSSDPNEFIEGQSPNPKTHRIILSIAQDILYASVNGALSTPKHVGLAVSIKHMTGSAAAVSMINKFGHCVSNEELSRLDTACAAKLLQEKDQKGVVIPSNITPGTFIQAAADNLDINEDTLDGKLTTHSTSLVLYQRATNGQFGNIPNTITVKSSRKRSIDNLSACYDMLQFSTLGRKVAVPLYSSEVCENLARYKSPEMDSAIALDRAWVFLRLCPSKHFSISLDAKTTQIIPGWSAFNVMASDDTSLVSNTGYCPLIPSSPTEFDTVYTVMKTVGRMMKLLDQKHSVITFDEAIYCKAKEIQWRRPDEFSHTVLRLGGFHTALTFLAVIGKRYADSGLGDLLIESGVYGSGTVDRIMNGRSYNKSVRALKLTMEALSRLRIRSYAQWLHDESNFDHYCLVNALHETRDLLAGSELDGFRDSLKVCIAELKNVSANMDPFCFQSKSTSDTFTFWDEFIDMVEILLCFIRAERDGYWFLHLSSLADMLPYFFAYDRTNYSRWATVYYFDMLALERSAPEVYREFSHGNFSVKRSNGKFNQVWTDMALEQSANKDAKTKGGVIGFSTKPSALTRWFLTAHERASIVSATKLMCGMKYESQSDSEHPGASHKEGGSTRQVRDESDVQS